MPSSSTSAVALLTQYLRGLERGDIDAATASFAEDVVIKVPCMPEPTPKLMVGRATYVQLLQGTFANVFKKLTWTALEIHASDDPNLAFALAKSSVELWNGSSYSNDYVIYVRVMNGKIVEEVEFFDTARAAKAFTAPA